MLQCPIHAFVDWYVDKPEREDFVFKEMKNSFSLVIHRVDGMKLVSTKHQFDLNSLDQFQEFSQ